jgi:hypothetical protein
VTAALAAPHVDAQDRLGAAEAVSEESAEQALHRYDPSSSGGRVDESLDLG